MDHFIYDAPTRVYFGRGEENRIGELIKEFEPHKVLIHYGGGSAVKSGLIGLVEKSLDAQGIAYIELGGVVPNPELSLVRKGIELCEKEGADFVLAVGGGSVMDSAKAICNGAANPKTDVWDFNIRKATPKKSLHKGAILTIAAAGSEMSDSCVITNEQTGEKRGYSCHCNHMDFAIEDPELTYSVSPYQTACGIVDIGMHTIERYFYPSPEENTYLIDGVAEAILRATFKAGKDCLANPTDYVSRATLMWASSISHNGLTQRSSERFLTVHQIEHEISGMFPKVSHGAGLAALWCTWARYVYSSNLKRWSGYAENVWGVSVSCAGSAPNDKDMEIQINKAIDMQEEYYRSIGMPTSLRELGVPENSLESLALAATRNRTRTLPGYKELAYDDILAILKAAL